MCKNHHDLLEMAVIESLPLRQFPSSNHLQCGYRKRLPHILILPGGAALRLAGGHGDDSGSSIDHVHSGVDHSAAAIVRLLNETGARRCHGK